MTARVFRPLVRQQYRLLLVALAAAMLADGLWLIASVWQVIHLGGSPVELSMVSSAMAVGMLVSTIFGGVLADRVPQRHILLVVEATKAVLIGGSALLAFTGLGQVWHLAVAALLIGLGSGLFYPAYTALLPSILPSEELLAANGFEGVLRPTMMQAAGPALAGLIVAAWSAAAAMAGTAFLLVVAGVVLLRIVPIPVHREATTSQHPVRSVVDDVMQGARYMVRTPWLLGSLLFASLMMLAMMGPFEVLTPFVIKDRMAGGAGEHAWVLAAFGIGGASASLAVASIRMPRRYLTVTMLGWGLACLPLIAFGVTDRLWLMIAAAFVMGAGFNGSMVIWGTLLQRRVPPALLGRVASLDFFVSMAFMPLSMAIAGPLSVAIGINNTFLIAGLVPLAIAVVILVAARMPKDELAHPLDSKPAVTES